MIQNFLRAITNYNSHKPVHEWIVREYAEFVAKDLVNVKSSQTLGVTIVKRFIWELMSQWSLQMKIQGSKSSDFDDLASAYQDSPQLLRMLDDIIIHQHTEEYSRNRNGNPQGPGGA